MLVWFCNGMTLVPDFPRSPRQTDGDLAGCSGKGLSFTECLFAVSENQKRCVLLSITHLRSKSKQPAHVALAWTILLFWIFSAGFRGQKSKKSATWPASYVSGNALYMKFRYEQ
jgi:hypothetical protein